MGYNIEELSGNFTGTTAGGADGWVGNFQMGDPGVTTITGDFGEPPSGSESSGGYTFSPLSTTAWGTLTFNTTNGQFTFTVDKAAVIASGSDQTVTFTVTGTEGGRSDTDDVTINILICVARGTMIRTPDGDRAVEDLAVGDMVLTRDHGPQPVRWVGSRRVGAAELAADASLRPIRFRPGAIDGARPATELLVSPQHRILVTGWKAELLFGTDELLVPAKGLVNDQTVTTAHDVAEVEYFHLLFDRHQIIVTNGAETESFFPGSYSLQNIDEAAREEIFRLFPELRDADTYYSPTARTSLTPTEGRVLSARFDARKADAE